MPAMVTHILILEKTIEKMKVSDDPNLIEAATFLENNINLANLGSLGPDLFYYCDKDQLNTFSTVSTALGGVTQLVKNFFDDLENKVKSGEQSNIPGVGLVCHISDDVLQFVEATTGIIIESFDNLLLLVLEIIISVVSEFASPNPSLMHSMGMLAAKESDGKILKGMPVSEFAWGDLLHYEACGTFAEAMLKVMNENQAYLTDKSFQNYLVAYLMGYMTHIAGDVTGHAYVNQVVGGPARCHSWRASLAELTMDKYLWKKIKGDNINLVHIDTLIDFSDDQKNELSEVLSKACGLLYNLRDSNAIKIFGQPDEVRGINENFTESDEYPISSDNIRKCIDNIITAAKLLHQLDIPFPDPPDVFTPSEALEEIEQKVSNAADALLPDNINDAWDVIKGIVGAILLAAYAIETFVESMLASAISLGMGIASSTLFGFETALYYAFYAMRRMFVYLGLLFPDDIMMQEQFCKQFIQPCFDQDYPRKRDVIHGLDAYSALKVLFTNIFKTAINASSGTEYSDKVKGLREKILGKLDENPDLKEIFPVIDRNPFAYPESSVELSRTIAGFYDGKSPECLLEGKFDPLAYSSYANSFVPSETDSVNHNKRTSMTGQDFILPIGDAVGMSLHLIDMLFKKDTNTPLTDWNLDSDRGYGYKFWVLPKDKNMLNSIDIDGFCTNPQL